VSTSFTRRHIHVSTIDPRLVRVLIPVELFAGVYTTLAIATFRQHFTRRATQMSILCIKDEWKLNDRLTLESGVRSDSRISKIDCDSEDTHLATRQASRGSIARERRACEALWILPTTRIPSSASQRFGFIQWKHHYDQVRVISASLSPCKPVPRISAHPFLPASRIAHWRAW